MWKKIVSLVCVLLLAQLSIAAQVSSKMKVPEPLQTWIPWALDGTTDLACAGQGGQRAELPSACAWPGVLDLKLSSNGGEFVQTWRVLSETWVSLPGDSKNWPQAVLVDGKPVPVLGRDDTPSLFLAPGSYRVVGRFEWKQLPEFLSLAQSTALLALTLNGAEVMHPVRDEHNVLWLQKKFDETSAEEVQLKVFRRIRDDIPVQLETRFHLEVSGRAREIRIGRALLPRLIPQAIDSKLNALLDKDGSLVVQARPGAWDIRLYARLPQQVDTLVLPPSKDVVAEEEIWVFAANDALRLAKIEGATAIDTHQTSLPAEWQQLPAYYMSEQTPQLQIKELQRGDGNVKPDKLALERKMWLSLDGHDWTVSDHIVGNVESPRRLNLLQQVQAGRMSLHDEDQQISQARDHFAGIEIGAGALKLSAEHKLLSASRRWPNNLWQADFDSAAVELQLPPGWRLFMANGADKAEGAWLTTWTWWEGVLILAVVILAGLLWGRVGGAISLAFLLLCHQELGNHGWLFVLFFSLLLLTIRSKWGQHYFCAKLQHVTSYLTRFLSLALLIGGVAFASSQLRALLYPHLDVLQNTPQTTLQTASQSRRVDLVQEASGVNDSEVANAPAEAPPPPPAERVYMMAPPQSQDAMAPAYLPPPEVVVESMNAAPAMPAAPAKSAVSSLSTEHAAYKFEKNKGIDRQARIQTGPGLPLWAGTSHRLNFDGPVKQDHELDLWLISPTMNGFLSLLRLLLMCVLLWWATRRTVSDDDGDDPLQEKNDSPRLLSKVLRSLGRMHVRQLLRRILMSRESGAKCRSHVMPAVTRQAALFSRIFVSMLACAALNLWPRPAAAQSSLPSDEMLQQLKERLSRPANCQPNCAEISRMTISISGNQARLKMDLDANIDTPLALPFNRKSWLPHVARLDGQSAFIQREDNGQLYFLVPAGRHRLELVGELKQSDSLLLPLPHKPRRIDVDAPEWEVSGISDEHEIADAVQFSRRQKQYKGAQANANDFPALLRIRRQFYFEKEWMVETTVERLSPLGTAVLAQVPLVSGEAVTTAGVVVKQQQVQVNLGPQLENMTWVSTLKQAPNINLQALQTCGEMQVVECLEHWEIRSGSAWHLEIKGIPRVTSSDPNQFLFKPWPGEQLMIQVDRPQAVPGPTATLLASRLDVNQGKRHSDMELTLNFRSSRAVDHVIRLPEGAQLESVKLNGRSLNTRLINQALTLNLTPGQQEFVIKWRKEQEAQLQFQIGHIDLGLPSINHQTSLKLMPDRWVLGMTNAHLGPVNLLWPKCVLLIVLFLMLMRWKVVPVNVWQWSLLALAMSQLPWFLILSWLLWFYLVAYRGKLASHPEANRISAWQHNALQLLLGFLTMLSLFAYFSIVRAGFDGQVATYITGNGSNGSTLIWYFDRIAKAVPTLEVISLPIIAYRLLMLGVSIGIACAIVPWVKWAWTECTRGGIWRSVSELPEVNGEQG